MKRTGQSKIAVVGWGRGMGHKGHMYLADAVIQQAKDMNADPYFFVSKTVGKDDPILPEEKVRIYQKVFPQYATIFEPQGNLNQALTDLAGLGYQGVVVVVGADQKEAFQYLVKPNKEGVPVFQTMGLKKLKVISRQETRSQYRSEEGPRATPMREILLDPNATEEDKFKVWRRDMPEQLSDREVLDVMNKAESRMMHQPAKQAKVKQMSQKVAKLKEAIQVLKTKKQSDSEKNSDAMGYKHLFKQPDEEQQSKEKRFHGWAEYEKDKNPEPVEEALIMDRNSKINAYYLAPSGARHKVAEGIPYYLLDKLVDALTKKYNITMKDIEVRPADVNQYRRSSHPELAEEQGMEEGYIFKGGFPFDVDHMPGAVHRNRDETTDIVKTKNKDKWDDMVDIINDEVFDDMADFRTNSEGETVTGNSAVWAKWDNATQTGWINRKGNPLKPWPVKEQDLNEFAPGNGDDDDGEYDLEFQVYQCNPQNQFEFIGGPLHQNNDLGRAHDFAYKLHMKHPDKAFMVWQPSVEHSRGGYGLPEEDNNDYLDE